MEDTVNIHPKAAGGALGGAIATIAIWLLAIAHVPVPPEVAAAFATIAGAIVAYATPS